MNRKVYSTDAGRLCPGCGQPVTDCHCGTATACPAGDGNVRVGRETRGRRGRGVTVVSGLPLDPSALTELARELKARCGAGGQVRDGVIEIQGEHRDKLVAELRARGYRAKRTGG